MAYESQYHWAPLFALSTSNSALLPSPGPWVLGPYATGTPLLLSPASLDMLCLFLSWPFAALASPLLIFSSNMTSSEGPLPWLPASTPAWHPVLPLWPLSADTSHSQVSQLCVCFSGAQTQSADLGFRAHWSLLLRILILPSFCHLLKAENLTNPVTGSFAPSEAVHIIHYPCYTVTRRRDCWFWASSWWSLMIFLGLSQVLALDFTA